MASRQALNAVRQVKPLISSTPGDAKIRVLSLYKAWYRHIPYMVRDFDVPPSIAECRQVLRENFKKNANVRDLRVIDMLVFKGQQDLKEVVEHWKQPNHIMAKWFSSSYMPEKPKDFIGKFLSGQD
eukprot:TRINITY_DN6390_c1_g1_i1.p1 TRINITY_DN6390_c1_g1~~TRINITY_DN6390_c1_g1_i1.p1  ORF type:complete len:126 (-),score=34.06 TRINITY_DN6390_c1_g1_i1:110-487(-)